MASELTMIHGVPPDCDEREFLRELQNALLWINFRYHRAAVLVRGGRTGAGTADGLRVPTRPADRLPAILRRMNVYSPALMPSCTCSTGFRCVW